MLLSNSGAALRHEITPDQTRDAVEAKAVWLDLLNPSEDERTLVERATGLRVPSQHDLAEIETSSRAYQDKGALYLSTPMAYRTEEGVSKVAPLGFVLSRTNLLTIRFANLPVFDRFADRFAEGERGPACSSGAFVGLLEAIVDRMADVLERVGNTLDHISHRVFRPDHKRGRKSARVDTELRATLRAIGRAGDTLSNIRDSLLGVSRLAHYSVEAAKAWIPAEVLPRFTTLRQDLASLNDYDAQLTNKVQFLLDATLGFINIEQNNGIKILTVVSVVGVPPTLVASMYGMNFQHMPELAWTYGYPYGLAMIALSAIAPLVWFKWKGWV